MVSLKQIEYGVYKGSYYNIPKPAIYLKGHYMLSHFLESLKP